MRILVLLLVVSHGFAMEDMNALPSLSSGSVVANSAAAPGPHPMRQVLDRFRHDMQAIERQIEAKQQELNKLQERVKEGEQQLQMCSNTQRGKKRAQRLRDNQDNIRQQMLTLVAEMNALGNQQMNSAKVLAHASGLARALIGAAEQSSEAPENRMALVRAALTNITAQQGEMVASVMKPLEDLQRKLGEEQTRLKNAKECTGELRIDVRLLTELECLRQQYLPDSGETCAEIKRLFAEMDHQVKVMQEDFLSRRESSKKVPGATGKIIKM